jgi:hypothetical protein
MICKLDSLCLLLLSPDFVVSLPFDNLKQLLFSDVLVDMLCDALLSTISCANNLEERGHHLTNAAFQQLWHRACS